MKTTTVFYSFVIASCVALLVGCASTLNVTKVNSDTKASDGVYYTLPRTVVVVEVSVTNTIKTPGKFANVASSNGFALETVVTNASTNFSIGAVSIQTIARPDPDQVFRVKIQGNYFEDRNLTLEMDESGLLVSGSSEADNRAIEFSTQLLETGGGIAGKVLKFGGNAIDDKSSPAQYKLMLDTIQSRRFDLISGQLPAGVNPSAETMKLQLDELKSLEKSLTAEFTGKTTTKVWTGRFEVDPQNVGDVCTKLFSINSSNGVSSSTAINPVPKEFTNSANDGVDAVNLNLILKPVRVDTKIPTHPIGKMPEASGFYYRYPTPTIATVTQWGKMFARESTAIAQFGPILTLPRSTTSKSSKQQITLFKATGGLNKITVSSKSWDPNQISKIGNAAGSILDSKDELAKLERERKILEEKKKLRDAQKALDATP